MATLSPETPSSPAWTAWPVMIFNGARHTNVHTGEDYATQPLASIFTMAPADKGKGAGLAFIPSTYADYDGREHAAQRDRGSFVALTGDIDHGDHGLNAVRDLVRTFAGDAAWLVYSSAHARPGDMRWRIVLPLAKSVAFPEWHDAQNAFYDFMEAHGVEMDRALARAAQPVYAPNVPQVHASSGTALRGDDGKTLYFKRASSGLDKPGLALHAGHVAAGLLAIRHKRAEDDKERDRIRLEAEQRRASKPRGDGASLIDDFNASNSVATMLEICGYTQCPRNAEDWRSPQQTGETYATRVIGSKWVSLSQSDAASGLGTKCAAGCYGDAYDLELHYRHGGDHKAAFRAIGAERRGNVIRPEQFNPPEWMNEIPPYDDAPEWGQPDGDVPDAVGEARDDAQPHGLVATAFTWRAEADIPPRKWLYGRHLIRKFLSLDIAAGGVGKSSVKIVETLAMTTGRPLLNKEVFDGPLNVWLYNLEDPDEETERRIVAAAKEYHIDPEDVGPRLFVNSGRDQPLVIADETPDGARIMRPVVEALIAEILEKRIDVLVLDPFVSSHAISENDNRAIDMVAKEWSRIADICNCSINLVHHVRKSNGTEVTAESSRGAIALIGAARSVIVYNKMTKEEGERAGIEPSKRGFYFRTQNDKANLAPAEAADWHRMNNVDLDNGDSVGVACPWQWPDSFDGVSTWHLKQVQEAVSTGQWRSDIRAKDAWVGNLIGQVCNIELPKMQGRVKDILKQWLESDMLRIVERLDQHRKPRDFVEVGQWHTD